MAEKAYTVRSFLLWLIFVASVRLLWAPPSESWLAVFSLESAKVKRKSL